MDNDLPTDKAIRRVLLKPIRKWIKVDKGRIRRVCMDIIRTRLKPSYYRRISPLEVHLDIRRRRGKVMAICKDFYPYITIEACADNQQDALAMMAESYRRAMWEMSDRIMPEDFFNLYTLIMLDNKTGYGVYRDGGIAPSCAPPHIHRS